MLNTKRSVIGCTPHQVTYEGNLLFGQRLHPNCLTLIISTFIAWAWRLTLNSIRLAYVQHTNELYTWIESNITTMVGNMRTVLYFAIFCFVVNAVGEYSFRSKKLLYSCACPFYSLSSDHLVYWCISYCITEPIIRNSNPPVVSKMQ